MSSHGMGQWAKINKHTSIIKINILTGTEMCQARVDFNLSVLVGLALYVSARVCLNQRFALAGKKQMNRFDHANITNIFACTVDVYSWKYGGSHILNTFSK